MSRMKITNQGLLLYSFISAWFLFIHHVRSSPMERSTYIIHMDKYIMPKPFLNHHHWYSSTVDSCKQANPSSSDGSSSSPTLLYAYDNVLHGFSAVLSPKELEILKNSVGFVSAYSDQPVTPHTTHTPEFLSLNPSAGLWPTSDYGRDVIIGVIDSGVWPESDSYKDNGMTNVPAKWKGQCEVGQDFNASMCNNKLIGARYFNKGVLAHNPQGINISMNSARDTQGHGTHTSSTAAGNYVENVSFFGYAKGTARGIAPHAKLAIYKVLWDEGCYNSDVIAAIDKAVEDGVDILSISLGFAQTNFYENPVAIASFGAMGEGVFVSTSGGNEGPSFGSLMNGIPWTVSVAAGTIDRTFAGTLSLGNGLTILGWTMFPANALVDNYPLFYNETLSKCDDPNLLALSPYAIIICDQGNILEQLEHVARSNAAGAIFISDDPVIFEKGGVPWPGIIISPKEAQAVLKYAKTSENPTGSMKFLETIMGTKPSPKVAIYSSRGPAKSYPWILKPDLMAPGSLVLAAFIPNGASAIIGGGIVLSSDYTMESGTSMACPHVAGIAALLKGAHPDWSPAVIRSALMTTANPLDNTNNLVRENGQNLTVATPLATGSGHVDPNRATDPGLIYDAAPHDYVNLLCSMNYTQKHILAITRSNHYNCSNPSADLNYPSFISFYTNKSANFNKQSFRRIVTNVGNGAATYKAKVTAPRGSRVTILPDKLVFAKKFDEQSYTLSIVYRGDKQINGTVTYGSLLWIEDHGTHTVRSPIVVSPMPTMNV